MLKIIKKRLAKKSALVKRSKKGMPLVIAPPGAAFWVNNGPALHHLLDLSKFLSIITEEQFRYHTERDGNDFSRWVGAILGDSVCARALELSKTVAVARQAVAKALKRYDA